MSRTVTAEHQRLADSEARRADWKNWGPYLSERAWGTVREDYSATAKPGTIFPTTTPAAAPIAGTRTAWPGSAIASRICAWPLACGTSGIPSSRNGSLG